MSNEVLVKQGNKAEWSIDSTPIDPKRLPEGYPYKEQSEVTLTFDPAVNTEAYNFLRKISDTALLLPGLIGAKVKILSNDAEYNAVIKKSDITSGEGYYTVMAISEDDSVRVQFISIYEAQTQDSFGMDVPVGVYVIYKENGPYVAEINAVSGIIYPIAAEFLPTEEWTFTLEDGSTVIKKVVVGA